MYGYAFSLFLIAVGAILRFAVTISVNGVNLDTTGAILMIIGIVGIVFTFGFRLLAHDEVADTYRDRRRRDIDSEDPYL